MTSARHRSSASSRSTSATASTLMLAALFLAGVSTARAESSGTKQPKLTTPESVHETGEIARDQVVEHSFRIRNSGDAPLTIHDTILPPNLELLSRPTTLAPGEEGDVRVRVPLLHDKAVALAKQLTLLSNDPTTPSFPLELRILSTEFVVAKPGFARWNSVQREGSGKISPKLTSLDGKDFEILGVSGTPAGISSAYASTRKDAASPREWTLDLTLAEDAPVGAIVGFAMVKVNHPRQSIVPIPLSGFMRPVMAVTPPTLSFGEINLTAKFAQPFNVKSFATAAIHVTRAEHDLPGVGPATISTVTDGREYVVKIDFDPATTPKGNLRGTLTIHTDSAKVPTLLVPIDGKIN
jgi:hypothetical protein